MRSLWCFGIRFRTSESGATAIEYGLILALMALVLVGALASTGDSAKDRWDGVAEDIAAAHQDAG